jgi:hypothetical protein
MLATRNWVERHWVYSGHYPRIFVARKNAKNTEENWMPIKCQRVSEQEVGAKGPGLALADSSIWGSESTPVDLDLKNSVEEWAWVVS